MKRLFPFLMSALFVGRGGRRAERHDARAGGRTHPDGRGRAGRRYHRQRGSQVGTIAIDPREPSVTVSGQWHNSDAKLVAGEPTPSVFGSGDGFETGFDPSPATALGIRMVYHNCNAGFGGSIC
ncbi:MAG TPA: hypothetical protein VNZ44_16445, partial [Pyrinomonadaceae bacterium]|nr:hypothetical protein [Pyrinomonadaceae bacterium]